MADQYMRLAAFRRAHPEWHIIRAEFGTWEARWAHATDSRSVFGDSLDTLLDKLELLLRDTG